MSLLAHLSLCYGTRSGGIQSFGAKLNLPKVKRG